MTSGRLQIYMPVKKALTLDGVTPRSSVFNPYRTNVENRVSS